MLVQEVVSLCPAQVVSLICLCDFQDFLDVAHPFGQSKTPWAHPSWDPRWVWSLASWKPLTWDVVHIERIHAVFVWVVFSCCRAKLAILGDDTSPKKWTFILNTSSGLVTSAFGHPRIWGSPVGYLRLVVQRFNFLARFNVCMDVAKLHLHPGKVKLSHNVIDIPFQKIPGCTAWLADPPDYPMKCDLLSL